MDEKVLKNLEFNKVIDKISKFINSNIGIEKLFNLKPSKNIEEIKNWQKETTEAVSVILKKGSLKMGGLRDIRPFLKRVAADGVLNAEELLKISDFLRTSKMVKDYFSKDSKNEKFDILESKVEDIVIIEHLEREINRCILSSTEIADNASQDLLKVRKNIKIFNQKIKEQLNNIINSSSYKNMLQEPVITVRGDRYCVPIKAEFKNSFPGMVHDQSSTGATFFIEPISVVQLNNKIKELLSNEKHEIDKILKKLSTLVFAEVDNFNVNLEILAYLDFVFAKAEYSISIKGIEPIFNKNGYINLKKARHPLIDPNFVVPTDIFIGKDFNTLLITGPNTGGKTVSLKTIGLFTIMGQCGLHISAFDNSELSVFSNIFSDIGDEQSIEQSLSTFSSHMKNIINIINNVTENSLVLLDELGSGTDPTEGAYLAISIIEYLHQKNITTIVTTHYNELKLFALSTSGVENASCEFDVNTLKPTYKLLIGVPGKSNAFAISKRLGLSDDIINNAKALINNDNIKFEDVITDLEISKKTLIIEKERAETYRQEIERLKKDIQKQKRKTKEQKEKILLKANEDAKRIVAQAKIESDKIVKEVQKFAKDAKKTQELNEQRQKLKDKINYFDTKIDKFNNNKNDLKITPTSLKKGDKVFVNYLNQNGVVINPPNIKGDVMVSVGIMRININIGKLSPCIENDNVVKEVKVKKSIASFKHSKSKDIASEVDLRGLYVEDAILKVEKYIDDAYLSGISTINIIHGKGTGALRSAIHTYLKKSSRIKEYRLGEFGEGDAGVTIAKLK